METVAVVKEPRIMGIRAEASCFHWAIVEGSQEVPVLVESDCTSSPIDSSEPESLAFLRERFLLLLTQFDPVAVAVRYSERTPGSGNKDGVKRRLRLEGVIVEAVQGMRRQIETGPLKTIASNLESKSAKKYLEEKEFRGVDWSKLKTPRREAILAAVSLLKKTEGD